MDPSPKTIELRARKNECNKKFRWASWEQSKTTTLHVHYTFWFISLPLFHDSDMKFACATCYGGCKQTKNLSFTFFTCVRSLRIELRESSHTFHIFSDLLYLKKREFIFMVTFCRRRWGSFSIDDDPRQQKTSLLKWISVFKNICRVYSNSLKTSNVSEFPWSWFLGDCIHV